MDPAKGNFQIILCGAGSGFRPTTHYVNYVSAFMNLISPSSLSGYCGAMRGWRKGRGPDGDRTKNPI